MEPYGEAEVRQFLEAHGLKTQIRSFDDSTENAFLAAQALGVEQGQIVKSVLFLTDGEPVLVLMSGDMNVHNKKLKKLVGAKKVKMADPESVVALTGYQVGAVPPIAHRQSIATYLDESLKRFSTIYPAAGTTSNMFPTTFEELSALTKAEIVDVAMPKKK
jgi:Cys-tRNA(Pro) deacylase